MTQRPFALLLTLIFALPATAKNPTALFYLMNSEKSTNSFLAHADKIDTLVPTWYRVDPTGVVNGTPNEHVYRIAQQKKITLTPILSMSGGRNGFHTLLHDEAAKTRMNTFLVKESKARGYKGFQFDFENIAQTDRDAYTLMVKQTAEALHKAGMTLSIAVVPNAPGHPEEGGPFSKWMWKYWRGVYNLKALGQAADLISLMTYDQHTRWTTPGPVAGMPWTKKHLEYALTQVPKEKLSLGIPSYGYRWFTGNPVRKDGTEASNISGTNIDADESFPLAITQKANVQWDPIEQESWFYFYRDNMREWVFRPDAHSFRARYDLVKQNGLEGFSCWVLGAEDPKMWDELPLATH
ncbi:glycoside hydrolase family 18 protein [Xylella fastidiosa]|uniref:Glycoside hydrolase family 18 protein n=1 Tax=Xylella fastidiosa TaxID=2371 RepID=A0ABC8AFQ9_XYLFS|nr:glycoside hydrolase family 18 protein [Xylella fastidiosa]ALR04960.1 glycoside hydrolase family 18 protein [Xylella fastidiosa]ALR07302.1 glycoside hydrolase family 18 protein [Xylella fastidiosa]KXB19455.1 glycosyl hydrolase [Xylella fastidiosa]OJZ69884.1 glycosyl hydrolase [Xylella fastidiosa 6c]TNW22254.1 glycosyl hydrolase [Xylella fastidiosa subsp. pauca]